jgi:hypothetical protein
VSLPACLFLPDSSRWERSVWAKKVFLERQEEGRHADEWFRLLCQGIIYQTFQGDLKIETQKIVIEKDAGGNEKPRFDISRGEPTLPPPLSPSPPLSL